MDRSILERVNEKKVRASMTIDESLFTELTKLRKQKKLKSLSPLINELLWKWVNENAGDLKDE